MKVGSYIILCILLFLSSRCSESKISIIDVSSMDYRTNQNVPNGTIGNTSNQWIQQNFTSQEMALFNDLDTASLEGTSSASIKQSNVYPNPFRDYFIINPWFQSEFQGSVVVKYVIVNAVSIPVSKGAFRLNYNKQSLPTFGAIPTGSYRIYITYSASDNEHFFKCWGNIRKY